MKPCRKCGAQDRLANGECKPCHNARTAAYRAKNAEAVKANRDRWRAENREKLLEQGRLWKEKNYGIQLVRREKGQCKTCGGTRRFKGGSCIPCSVEQTRKYREANSTKVKVNRDRWRGEKADVLNAQNHKRRKLAKERGVLSDNIAPIRFAEQGGLCNCCYKPLGDKYDLDHIMPLSLGGENVDDNIQLLRASCNRSKGAKNPLVFAISRAMIF